MGRALAYVLGSTVEAEGAVVMRLCENDGTVVHSYTGARSFHRIERDGAWWRLAGADRETGEIIYLREVVVV